MNFVAEPTFPEAPEGTPVQDILTAPDEIEVSYQEVYPLEVGFYDQAIKTLLNRESSHGAIMELGCGFGRVAVPLAELGWRVIGLDRRKEMLDGLNRRASLSSGSIVPLLGDMLNIPTEEKVDAAICPLGVINLLWSHESLSTHLQSLAGILKPGGVALYLAPSAKEPQNIIPHHVMWETREGDTETRTRYGFESEANSRDIVRFYHHLTVRKNQKSYSLYEWLGRMRIISPEFLKSVITPDSPFELEGWLRAFDPNAWMDGPLDADICSVFVLRRK